jgi:hypothetical protein
LSSFNHFSWLKHDPWSLKAKALAHSTLNGLVSTDFRLFGFLEDENRQEVFLRFRPDITKKMRQERKLACDETELNQTENSSRARLFRSNKYHTAIRITRDKWR